MILIFISNQNPIGGATINRYQLIHSNTLSVSVLHQKQINPNNRPSILRFLTSSFIFRVFPSLFDVEILVFRSFVLAFMLFIFVLFVFFVLFIFRFFVLFLMASSSLLVANVGHNAAQFQRKFLVFVLLFGQARNFNKLRLLAKRACVAVLRRGEVRSLVAVLFLFTLLAERFLVQKILIEANRSLI